MAIPNTFCCLPWIHLATHPDGHVSLCCQSEMKDSISFAQNNSGEMLNLNKDSIGEIYNSDRFKEVRQAMLENKRHPACETCYKIEDAGGESKRQYENRAFTLNQEVAKKITSKDGEIEPNIEFIELRLGNSCNLKCISCNPNSSTLWKRDNEKIKEMDASFDKGYSGDHVFKWSYSEEFWDSFKDECDLANLKRIYINGGEPLINKQLISFLKELIELEIAKNIELVIHTNMTIITEELIDLWKAFKHVTISASIDDLDQRNNYIRFPAKWDNLLENLDRIVSEHFKTTICQTVSCINLPYLDEFASFFHARYNNKVEIYYNFVTNPEYLDPNIIDFEMRLLLFQKFKKTLTKKQLNQIEPRLVKDLTSKESERKRFISYIKLMDKIRETDFNKFFPNFKKLTHIEI